MKKKIGILSALTALLLTAAVLTGCAETKNVTAAPSASAPGGDATATASESPSAAPTATASETPSVSATPSPDVEAAIETDAYTYKNDYIDVSIEIPVVSGLPDTAAADKINAAFKDIGEKAKKRIPDMEKQCKEQIEAGDTSKKPYELYLSYSVDYNRNGLLCITISDFSYIGGAHGGELRSSHTFELKTGKQLNLGDLMIPGSDYKNYINGVIRREIDKRTQSGELAELVTFKDIGDTPDFYLTDAGIVIYFQEYQYFPYAAGIQEFTIPYKNLSGMLRSDLKL